MTTKRVEHKIRAPRVKIDVTQKQIDDAVLKDSSHCMIQQAVKACVPSARMISVDIQTIRWSDPTKGLRYTYLTPRIGQVNIIRWDEGIKPQPYGFYLRGAQVSEMRSGTGPATRKSKLKRERLAKKRTLAKKNKSDKHNIPEIHGGTPPPLMRGKRREFGMRGMSVREVHQK